MLGQRPATASNGEAFDIPGLLWVRVLQYPLPGFFQQFERGHEFIDNPDLQGLLRLEQCSFKQ
ncbi:hypothetical protein D3C85_1783730 [compost metagenome]